MRRGTKAALLAVSLAAGALTPSLPAVANGQVIPPLLTDRAGDANIVSDGAGQAPGLVPVTTASAPSADITAAWVATDHRLVPAVRKGVKGREKAPYGFSTHIRLVEPPQPMGPGMSYVVRWRWNNCVFTTTVMIRGTLPDSNRALFTDSCAAVKIVLAAPEISGDEIVVHVPFGIDGLGHLFDGGTLGEIDAYSAHSDPLLFNVAEVIDYAPSAGPLGFFELGSDLRPRFIPNGGDGS
jgi:hypothetical protein